VNKFYIHDDEENQMTSQQEHEAIEREFDVSEMKSRTAMIGVGLIFLAFLLAFCATAHAQAACTTTSTTACFDASKTTGESPLTTQLVWSVPGAASCAAAGTTGWTGAVPTSGTRSLSGIGVKMTLTLSCKVADTTGKMKLDWTPPTQNTDGSALTTLGGYRIEYGTSTSALTQEISVPGATLATYTIEGLTTGTWFATVRARTTGCFPTPVANCYESAQSTAASKTLSNIPGASLPQLSLVLEPYKVPKPPTAVIATEVTAFAIEQADDGSLALRRVNLNPISTDCDDARCTVVAARQ
jgi:hypothetical protein